MTTAAEPQSIEEREERIKEIDERIAELDAEHAGTRMSDEARGEWNELNAERDEHAVTVKEMKARRERLRALAGNPAATERQSNEAPAFIRKRGNEIYDVSRIRSDSQSEEDFRDRLHDNAKRAIERAPYPVPASRKDEAQGEVAALLERADDSSGALARRILVTGNPVYDRAFGKLALGRGQLTGEEQRAMSLGVNTEGGHAVPFQLDPTVLLTSDGTVSPLRQIARVEQIVGKEWQGITSSGITVSRSSEGAEAGDNSFTIAQPTVAAKRVIADVRYSVEIDQDWPQLRSEIARLLADAKSVEEDTAFVTGDGTGNNPGGVVATLASASVIDAGTTFTSEDVYGLEEAVPVPFRGRGQFIANKAVYQAIRQFAEADGHDLWERLGNGQPSRLLGYPAHEASAMGTHTGAAATRYLMFGDFSQFLIVDRVGMNVEINPHIVGSSGRWTGQRALVALWRNSSRVLVDNAFRVLAVGSGA